MYNPGTKAGRVRLLISDVSDTDPVLTDSEIDAFLDMEGGVVKLAAAQALDSIASNEALVSKVIRTQDVATDGAKVAEVLHKRAAALRDQAKAEAEAAGDDATGFAFEVAAFSPYGAGRAPELTEWPS